MTGVVSGSSTASSHYASNTLKNGIVYVGSCDVHLGCGLFPSIPGSVRCACNLWPSPSVQTESILAGQANGVAADLNGQVNPGTQNNVFLLDYDANQLTLSPNNYLVAILLGGTVIAAIVLSVTFLSLRRRRRKVQRADPQASKHGAI